MDGTIEMEVNIIGDDNNGTFRVVRARPRRRRRIVIIIVVGPTGRIIVIRERRTHCNIIALA